MDLVLIGCAAVAGSLYWVAVERGVGGVFTGQWDLWVVLALLGPAVGLFAFTVIEHVEDDWWLDVTGAWNAAEPRWRAAARAGGRFGRNAARGASGVVLGMIAAVGLFGLVVQVGVAVVGDGPWLQAETILFRIAPGSPPGAVDAYVIDEGADHLLVMDHDRRRLHEIPTRAVIERRTCQHGSAA